MPKRKPGAKHVPPEPTDDHAVIEAFLTEHTMPQMQPLARRLDELVREVIPDLRYAVKWAKAQYGLEEQGWIMELATYHKTVNLVFFGGADMDPSPPLGDTDRSRYVKLASLEDADDPQLRSWIEQAASVPGWK